jgi:hypothetical protein
MKTRITLILSTLLLVLFTSCEKEPATSSKEDNTNGELKAATVTSGMSYTIGDKVVDYCGTALEATFRDYGNVSIFNDADSIYIKIELGSSKLLKSAYIYFGAVENVPVKADGTPEYKAFPYACTITRPNPSGVTLALSKNGNDCNAFFIKLATVEIVNDSTFIQDSWWVNGTEYNTAFYNNYCNQSCCTITPVSYLLYDCGKKVIGEVNITNDADSVYATYSITVPEIYLYTYQFLVDEQLNKHRKLRHPKANPILVDNTTTYTVAMAIADLDLEDGCFDFTAEAIVYSLNKHGHKVNWHKGDCLPKGKTKCTKKDYNQYCIQTCN